MTKILIKRGQAEADLPTLDPGEPAITFDSGGKLWVGTPSGNLEITGGGGGTPGGSDTQVQFNDGGSFGGAANLVYVSGNIGIGTSPDSLFHVHESANNTPLTITYSNVANALGEVIANHNYIALNDAAEEIRYTRISTVVTDETDGAEYGSFLIYTMVNGTEAARFIMASPYNEIVGNTFLSGEAYIGTSGDIASFSDSEVVFNENGTDRNVRFEGDTATNLVVIDAGTDSFQVGTATAGALLNVSPTGIIFNNTEADIDFRIAGSGVTNGVIYDAANNWTLFGTGTPSTDGDSFGSMLMQVGDMSADNNAFVSRISGRLLIKRSGSGTLGTNVNYQSDTTDGNQLAVLGAVTDTTGPGATVFQAVGQIRAVFTTHDHATRAMSWDFYTSQAGPAAARMSIGAGVIVGSPTGGDKGTGTINVSGNIYRNNTAYTNPDYALEYWVTGEIQRFATREGAQGYYRLSIDESEEFVRKNLHLPRISRDPAGIFDMADMALEKIEEAHIYIYELHNRIKQLEARLGIG